MIVNELNTADDRLSTLGSACDFLLFACVQMRVSHAQCVRVDMSAHGMLHLLPQHAHAPHTLTKLTATIVVSLQCMLQNIINYKHIHATHGIQEARGQS